MSTMSETVAKCREALMAMFSSDPSVDRDGANQYLNWVVDQPVVWEVIDTLLRQPDLSMNLYFWLANCLQSCLQRRFKELSTPEIRASFRDSLLEHIARFLTSPYTQVTHRLARCAGIVALHLVGVGEWPSAVPDLASRFSADLAQLSCLVEALGSFAEHAESRRMRWLETPELVAKARSANRHHSMREYMSKRVLCLQTQSDSVSASVVLSVLTRLLSESQDPRVQNAAFRCLADWTGAGYIGLQDFQSHPLFAALYQAVRAPALTVPAAHCLSGLLGNCYLPLGDKAEENQETLAVVEGITSSALPLLPLLQGHVEQENSAEACALAAVFLELGMFAIEFIAPVPETVGSSLAAAEQRRLRTPSDDVGLSVLQAAVEVTAAVSPTEGAAGSAAVVDVMFPFWKRLGNMIEDAERSTTRSVRSAESDLARARGRSTHAEERALETARAHAAAAQHRIAELRPLLLRAVSALVASLQYPQDAATASEADLDEVRDHRRLIAEALGCLIAAAGAEHAIEQIWALTVQAQGLYLQGGTQGEQWQPLEATLYAVRTSVAAQRDAGFKQERAAVMRVLELLASLREGFAGMRAAAVAAGNSRAVFGIDSVRYTATLVISQYSDLVDSPKMLSDTVAFAAESLALPSVAAAAAQALRSLVETKGRELAAAHMNDIFSLFSQLPTLPKPAQKDIVRAVVGTFAASGDVSILAQGLQSVVAALVSALEQVCGAAAAAAPGSGERGRGSDAAASAQLFLQLIALTIESTNPRDWDDPAPVMQTLVEVVRALSPYLSAATTTFPTDAGVCEAAVAVWRSVISTCKREAWPIAPEICAFACERFAARPNSAFIYLADRFIATFAVENNAPLPFDAPTFARQLFEFFTARVPALVQQWGSVEEDPAITDDFVSLGMTAIRSCPSVFLAMPSVVAAISGMARAALQATHKDAHNAAVRFYDSALTHAYLHWDSEPTAQMTELFTLVANEAANIFVESLASCGGGRRVDDSLYGVGLSITALSVCDRLNRSPPKAAARVVLASGPPPSANDVLSRLASDPRLAGVDHGLWEEIKAAGDDRFALRTAFSNLIYTMKGEEPLSMDT